MNYRLLLQLSFCFFIAAASIKMYVVHAQRQRIQIGTPKCELFNSNSDAATKCAKTVCTAGGDSFGNYTECSPDPYEQNKQLCEQLPYQNCEVTQTVKCSTDNRTINYSYYCPANNLSSGYTETIICPVTCTKCLTQPNAYGLCPSGYTNDNGCCIPREQIVCTDTTPDDGVDWDECNKTYPYNEWNWEICECVSRLIRLSS
jgi:hypothetical protein